MIVLDTSKWQSLTTCQAEITDIMHLTHIILINNHYNSNILKLILSVFTIIAITSFASFGSDSLLRGFEVYSQSVNETSMVNASAENQFIVNIRGISSFTEPNMIALISTGDDVAEQKK